MLEPNQKKLVGLMYKQEVMLGRLYKIFAAKFAEYADFWNQLSNEEAKHAELVKKLYQAEKKDLVAFSEGKIRTQGVLSFIEYVENLIKRAEKGEIDLKNAVAYTLDVEKSLLEKNVFSHFEAVGESMKGVMKKIANETRQHVAKAQALMEKIS